MLHIVNKSPGERSALASCLAHVRPGHCVLLIEDAVYAATTGNAAQARIREAAARMKIYALKPDMDARGVTARALDGVTLVDYGGFVDLVAEHGTPNSWL